MDKQKASKLIAEQLEIASKALREAVRISDKSGVTFHTPWGGEGTSERGMGATYVPGKAEDKGYYDYIGWNPSAHTC